MPSVFKDTLLAGVIDCSEILIEMPQNYKAQNSTYTNYKNNTCVPSNSYFPLHHLALFPSCLRLGEEGFRIKLLTRKSGFLQLLEYGDVVLADRGFGVSDDVRIHGAKLEYPLLPVVKVN